MKIISKVFLVLIIGCSFGKDAQKDFSIESEIALVVRNFFDADSKGRFEYISPAYQEATSNRPPDWEITLRGLDFKSLVSVDLQNIGGLDGWIVGVTVEGKDDRFRVLIFQIVSENEKLYVRPPLPQNRANLELVPWHYMVEIEKPESASESEANR